jgi:uncharacterized protein YgiM (DUF1202 family)
MRSRIASGMAGILIVLMLACNLPINQTPVTNDIPLSSPIVESITLSPSHSGDMPPAIGTIVIGPDEETILPAITQTLKPSLTTSAVTITSTEDTNCRKGPGVMYEIVGKLLVGQTSEVVARYQNGKFWLIKNPGEPTQTCWVWDETTRVTGNSASLPEATPPATPNITLSLTIYAIISPILYADSCPVSVELIGNYTVNTPVIISYQWYLGDLLVANGAVTAGSSGTFTSSNQIMITTTTTDPIRLKASAGAKSVTTSPISFSITCY